MDALALTIDFVPTRKTAAAKAPDTEKRETVILRMKKKEKRALRYAAIEAEESIQAWVMGAIQMRHAAEKGRKRKDSHGTTGQQP